jgi:hypothetical protein
MEFYMPEIEVSALNGRFKRSFSDHKMAKNFFSARNRFFWVKNPCEVNEFVSTTVVFPVVLPLRTLAI